jgi:hypothetical protein
MWTDLLFSVRALAKNPGFALVAIVTVALGIGANSAMFSVIHGVPLQPLPYRASERLVRLQEGHRRGAPCVALLGHREWTRWRRCE